MFFTTVWRASDILNLKTLGIYFARHEMNAVEVFIKEGQIHGVPSVNLALGEQIFP